MLNWSEWSYRQRLCVKLVIMELLSAVVCYLVRMELCATVVKLEKKKRKTTANKPLCVRRLAGSRQKWVPLEIEHPKGNRGRRSRSAGRRQSPPPNRRDPRRAGDRARDHGEKRGNGFQSHSVSVNPLGPRPAAAL